MRFLKVVTITINNHILIVFVAHGFRHDIAGLVDFDRRTSALTAWRPLNESTLVCATDDFNTFIAIKALSSDGVPDATFLDLTEDIELLVLLTAVPDVASLAEVQFDLLTAYT